MSDEDPKSLLFLCEDTIREILSVMPLKSRVRHKRTCHVLGYVADQQLLSVRRLRDEDFFAKPEELDSRLKTLSKMKNLQSVNIITRQKLDPNHQMREKIVSVLVDNCHYIREFHYLDLHHIRMFVTGLIGKGIPVRLKKIRSFGFELQSKDKKDLKFLLQKTDVKLSIFWRHADFIQKIGAWDRVVEVDDAQKEDGLHALPLHQMTSLKTMTGLVIKAGDEQFFAHLLHSLPHLKGIGVTSYGNANKLLPILTQAEQEFERIEFTMFDPVDFIYDVFSGFYENGMEMPDYEVIDLNLLKQLFEKKGHRLRSLSFRLSERTKRTEEKMQVLQMIGANCRKLKSFDITISDYSYVTERLHYFNWQLRFWIWSDVLLTAVLPITHKMRDIVLYKGLLTKDGRIPDQMMSELKNFAAQKKKYCIRADIESVDGVKDRHDEGNVRLVRS